MMEDSRLFSMMVEETFALKADGERFSGSFIPTLKVYRVEMNGASVDLPLGWLFVPHIPKTKVVQLYPNQGGDSEIFIEVLSGLLGHCVASITVDFYKNGSLVLEVSYQQEDSSLNAAA